MSYFNIPIDNDITYLLQEIGYNCHINNVPAKAIVNNLDRADGYDDKRIITHEPIMRGDYVNYADRYFMIWDNVNASRYNSYYKATMRVCNFDVKFIIDNRLYLFYACIDDNKFSINRDKLIEMSADTITVTLPANDRTYQLDVGMCFIKWGRKWRIEGIDYTKAGLITLYCKRDLINQTTDDMENEIADRWDEQGNDRLNGNTEPTKPFDEIPEEPEPEPEDDFVIVITGPERILITSEATYTATVYNNGVEVDEPVYFTISDTSLAKIGSQGDNQCVVKSNDDFKFGRFNLIATLVSDESVFAEKEIRIAGL